jgi:hypothetical protein
MLQLFVLLPPCIRLNFHFHHYQRMFAQIYLEVFQIMPKFMQGYSNDLPLFFLVLCRITYHLKLLSHLISLRLRSVLEHLDHLFKASFLALIIRYQLLCLMNEIILLLQILNLIVNQKLSIFYLFLFLLLLYCY